MEHPDVKKASDELSLFMSWLETKSPQVRSKLILHLFTQTFIKHTSKRDFKHGALNIMRYYSPGRTPFILNEKEVHKIFRSEKVFLEELVENNSVPGFLARLLIENYLENLRFGSRAFIEKLSLKSDEMEKILTFYRDSMEELHSQTSATSDGNRPDGKISKKALEHILSKPFYGWDLKGLILRSEDPKGRKNLKNLILDGFDEHPYSISKRDKISALVPKFCFLADHFQIYKGLEQGTIKPFPLKNKKICSVILKSGYVGKETTLHGDLEKIFDPDYSPPSKKKK